MAEVVRPQVSDPELRRILEDVGPNIENYHANLDGISNDIKSIESYLAASGIRISASIRIGGTDGALTDGDVDVMGNYSGGIYSDDESIEWAPVSDTDDRWRLMWVVVRNHGEVELCEHIAIVEPTYNGPTEQLDRKPLIETTIEIRLRAHKVLGKLLKKIGKLVEVRRPDITDDDIPF